MAKKKIYNPLKLQPKFKVFIAQDDGLTSLFGEPVQVDGNGRLFAVVPAHPEIKQYVKDLHPHWQATDDFVELEDEQ